jgi:hypothetical protein
MNQHRRATPGKGPGVVKWREHDLPLPEYGSTGVMRGMSFLRNLNLLTLLLAIGLTGCHDGRQHGQFSSMGSSMTPLEPTPGVLGIVSGYALAADGRHAGDKQTLLYLLVVCPGIDPRDNGISENDGPYTTTLKYSWGTEISVSIPWDRRADTVSIGGRAFDRSKGNVLVIRRGSDGKFTGQQLKSLDAKGRHLLCETVLLHIREQLPGDAVVASLRTSFPE